jgi:hypothetical protein
LITPSDCTNSYNYVLSLKGEEEHKSGYVECRSCLKHIPKEEMCVKVNSIFSYDHDHIQLFHTMMLSFCLNKQCLQNQPLHKQKTNNKHHYPDFNGKLMFLCKVISFFKVLILFSSLFLLLFFFVIISGKTINKQTIISIETIFSFNTKLGYNLLCK